jgi:hypothetical protein
MIKTILAYIIAWIAIVLLPGLLGVVFLPLTLIGGWVKGLAPAVTLLTSAGPMLIAASAFIWLCGRMQIQPTYLMFLLPYLAVMRNNFKRIDSAKRGNTNVARMAGSDYDSALQVRMEYGYLVGDIVGLLLPLLMISRLPFI